jgi:hypothetical protein
MTLGKPPRLDWVFQRYDPPLYFVTLCAVRRKKILANEFVHRSLIEYGERGVEKSVALGRYVIMPDHVHLFVRGGLEFNLGLWVRGLKRVVAAAVAGGREGLRGSMASPLPPVTAAATTSVVATTSGSADSSIISFAIPKVMRRNGITFGKIPCEQVWLASRNTGRSQARSLRSIACKDEADIDSLSGRLS